MKLVKNSGMLFAGNLSIALSSLILGILTARYLGPEGRGELYLAMQIITTGSLILAAGLGPSYQYHLAKGILSRADAIPHMAVQTLLVLLIVLFVFTLGFPLLDTFGLATLPHNLLHLSALGIVLNVVVIFANSVLMNLDHGVRKLSLLNVAASISNVVVLILFIVYFSADVYVAVFAYFIGLSVRLIPSVYHAIGGVVVGFRSKWFAITRQLFAFSASTFMFNLVVVFVFRIDAFIINALLGFEALGKYAIAVTFAELALMLPNSIGTALFAHFPKQDETERLKLLQKTTRVVVLLTIMICLLLGGLSSLLVELLMGDKYIGSITPLRILLPGLIAMATNYVFANYFAGSGRPGVGAWIFAVGLLVNVLANFILIPIMGINGAALSSSLAYFAISYSFFFVIRKTNNVSAASLFVPNKEDLDWVVNRIVIIMTQLKNRFSSNQVK